LLGVFLKNKVWNKANSSKIFNLKEKIEVIGVFDKNEDRLYEKIQRAAQ
jgi:hypothetical protein